MAYDKKILWKQIYNTLWVELKSVKRNKSESHSLCSSLSDNCTTLVERVIGEAVADIKSANLKENENNNTPVNILDKDKIIYNLTQRIEAGGLSKDQELKYYAELNKLQANYADDIEQEYIIEQVSYLCPVCDSERIKLKANKPIPTIFT